MSIKADLEDVKKKLEYRKQEFARMLAVKDSEIVDKRFTYGMRTISLQSMGIQYIILNDYKAAKEAFLKAIDYQDTQFQVEELHKFNYYPNTLNCIKLSMLTLDDEIMRKRTEKIFTNPPEDWKKQSSQYYYMVLAYVGMILGWDKNKLKGITSEGQKAGKHTVSDATLRAIEGILENDLDKFKDGYQQLVRHHSHADGRIAGSPEKYLSIWCTTLIIFAIKKGLDLKDFDPPFVDMGYLKSAQSI